MSRILIVEDEAHLANGLSFNLEAEGHEASIADTGEAALKVLTGNPHAFDAIVLDVMLPGKSGFEVAQELRKQQDFTPILILTARGRSDDVLQGFAAGADDYLTKPFELSILLARLTGLIRRREWSHKTPPAAERVDEYSFSDRTIDFVRLQVRTPSAEIPLTVMECDLLRQLILNEGKPVSRGSLLESVWGLREDTDTRAIDNFVVRLRKYLEEDPARPKHLLTVRGVGYEFKR